MSRFKNSPAIFLFFCTLSFSVFVPSFLPVATEKWSGTWRSRNALKVLAGDWERTALSQGRISLQRLHNIRGQKSDARLAPGYWGSTGRRRTLNNTISLWAAGWETSEHKQDFSSLQIRRRRRVGPLEAKREEGSFSAVTLWSKVRLMELHLKVGAVSVITECELECGGETAEVRGAVKIIPESSAEEERSGRCCRWWFFFETFQFISWRSPRRCFFFYSK